ncbi:eukaryotic translation initiation factor 4E [Lingula anatina]|uniref:Eukaryotic translation initiation factor 4E n=1 Tax=Lingula anatina TaxID=7574 RepID=A0A1S3IJI6_LINAN|nr:eukaryotic translation initiation factor 4E [Lingula anatina]|eukprot:XP_013398377.1 eukaryotic translation initiation factor 4E [Lingula anatina]
MASEQAEINERQPENSTDKGDQAEDDQEMTPEIIIKHPLQNRWALWFFKNDKAKDWASNLKLITSFDTVEDFWALYNHIQPASKLPSGCDYSLFKVNIMTKMADTWLYVLYGYNYIVVLKCNMPEYIMAHALFVILYASLEVFPFLFRKKLKERLTIPQKIAIGFQAHTDTIAKAGSTTKNRYTV